VKTYLQSLKSPRRRGRILPQAALLVLPLTALAQGVIPAEAVPVPTTASPGKPTAIVAMGDSFTSGEAGRWAGNSNDDCGSREGTDRAVVTIAGCDDSTYNRNLVYQPASVANRCHRSKTAPVLSATAGVDKRINLACSGARSQHLLRASRGGVPFKGEAPQADQLAALIPTHDIKAVFVGIGGNDIGTGFGEVVGECVKDYIFSSGLAEFLENRCREDTQGAFEPDMGPMQTKVLQTLQEVRDTFRTAGVPDASYRIILVGYPSIMPPSSQMRYGERNREHTAKCPIWDEDLDYFHSRFMPKLAANLRATAAVTASPVEFLDLLPALEGHRLCEDGVGRGARAAADAEWVRMFDARFSPSKVETVGNQGDYDEQFHPNQFGQQAIGRCYSRLLAAAPVDPRQQRTCRNGPTHQPSDMVLAALPTPPAVVDVTARSVPDNGVREASLVVPAGYGRPAQTAQVQLDITHPHRGQLRVTLLDNKGKPYVLHNPSTATGPNVFLSRNLPFIPADPAGPWRIRVEDLEGGSTGTLNRWGIEFF
jgi:hypothetical protein